MMRLIALIFLAMHAGAIASANPIVLENAKLGTPGWQLANPATAREIEGYASATSVNRGSSINLYVNTAASNYTIEVFRMGW